MKKPESQPFIAKLKRPESVLLLIACGGLALCLLLFAYALLPAVREAESAERQLQEAQRLLADLSGRSLPETITEEQIREMLLQVPIGAASDRLVSDLLAVQQDTGAVIYSMTTRQPEEPEEPDMLSQYLEAQAAAEGSGAAAANGAGPDELSDKSTFRRMRSDMEVVGTYAQLKAFIDRLYAHERLFSVDSWSIRPEAERLRASLQVSYFTADQYAPVFRDYVPAPQAAPEGTREDPTLSDQQFDQRLTSGEE